MRQAEQHVITEDVGARFEGEVLEEGRSSRSLKNLQAARAATRSIAAGLSPKRVCQQGSENSSLLLMRWDFGDCFRISK